MKNHLDIVSAPTMDQAMAKVRSKYGADAMIVNSGPAGAGAGVRVTVLIDHEEQRDDDNILSDYPSAALSADPASVPAIKLHELPPILARHGIPEQLIGDLCDEAADLDAETAVMALAGALDNNLTFSPLKIGESGKTGKSDALILVGPPGSGKTVTAGKLAAHRVLAGGSASLASTDAVRAGGIDQLRAYAEILGLDVAATTTREMLQQWTENSEQADKAAASGTPTLRIIDTAGANPLDPGDMEVLGDLVFASGAEPVLVLPAGGDPGESAWQAEQFAQLGVTRFIMTRIDTVQRHGSLPGVAAQAKLAICHISISPYLADGLKSLNPVSLARLLIQPIDQASRTKPDDLKKQAI